MENWIPIIKKFCTFSFLHMGPKVSLLMVPYAQLQLCLIKVIQWKYEKSCNRTLSSLSDASRPSCIPTPDTTRKWTIGPAQKYQLPYHPVLILASVPDATAADTFSPDRWTKVARENFWHRVMAQPGTNDQELAPGCFTARDQ